MGVADMRRCGDLPAIPLLGITDREHLLARGVKKDATDRGIVPAVGGQQRPARTVEDLGRPVAAAGGDPAPIGAPSDGEDPVAVAGD